MRRLFLISVLTTLMVCMVAGAAFAQHFVDGPGDRKATITEFNCVECHEQTAKHTSGPHGGYTSGSDKCSTCHDVHAAAENPQLLMGTTVTAACNYCHDLTATYAGPYNMTGTFTTAAAHRVVGVNVGTYTDTEGTRNSYFADDGTLKIPGGQLDGTEGVLDTTGQGKLSCNEFTCDSCHTPHGVNTVKAYLGESQVKYGGYNSTTGEFWLAVTNRLLKNRPNNLKDPVTQEVKTIGEYGSAWCAACHKGRDSAITGHYNHPVDETAPAYRFLELAYPDQFNLSNIDLGGAAPTKENYIAAVLANGYVTVGGTTGELKVDPRTNKQYAMTQYSELNGTSVDRNTAADGFDPLAPTYTGKGPSCQQCHGSARDVENKFAILRNPANNKNQDPALSNPFRGNFPHVSNNKGLLVEVQDDFCTNCHAPSQLP